MWVVSHRRRQFIFLLLLLASCSLVFVIHRSAWLRQEKRLQSWQQFHIHFLNEQHPYNVSTPFDPSVCANKTLFIGVGTRPESFDKRSSIRRSWAAELPTNVIMRFFVGRNESGTYMELKEEERRFGDTVYSGLTDAYDTLYMKASQGRSGLFWVMHRFYFAEAAFWLKADDDTTIHIARLLHHIEKRFKPAMNGTKAIFCSMWVGALVNRDRNSKLYVPRELFADNVYPPYCSGFSYLMSSDAVADVLGGARFVKAFKNEDALYTGVIANKMGILRSSHTDVFHYAGSLKNVTKCDGTGVPLSTAVYTHNGDPARFQADTNSFMKNQTCA